MSKRWAGLGLLLAVTMGCIEVNGAGGGGTSPLVDQSFGVNGRVTGYPNARPEGIAALADGSIAVASFNYADNANGVLLVTTMGHDGATPKTEQLDDFVSPTDLVAQRDGFVVSARLSERSAPDTVVVGFTANGNVDPSWADGGVTMVGGEEDTVVDLDVLADQSVVAATHRSLRSGVHYLHPVGDLIGAFTTFDSNQESISHVVALPGGRAAALGPPSLDGSIYAVSFQPGQPGSTTVYQSYTFTPAFLRRAMDVSLLDDEHIAVLLGTDHGNGLDIIGLDGSVRSLYTQGVVDMTAIVAKDGMVITAGEDGIIRRYTTADVLDTTFGDQGEVDLSDLVPTIGHLVLDGDGHLLVAGIADGRLAVVRVLL